MIAMGQILQMFSRFKSSSKRVFDYLDEEEIHNVDNPISLDDCKGEITFNHFSFIYPDGSNESLKDISFKILPGELIGVVGKIGSGKTTLVNSLLRLYNIEKNQILIDGVDIMDLDIKNLRDNIAYVPQDNFLFSSTVQENIAFSNKRMSIDKVKSAANFADVHENITNFKDGYNTMTGERGVTLSGGQKQRISIARAYAKEAPIMIMDDSVSAVDVKTEEAILSNIQEKELVRQLLLPLVFLLYLRLIVFLAYLSLSTTSLSCCISTFSTTVFFILFSCFNQKIFVPLTTRIFTLFIQFYFWLHIKNRKIKCF